MTLYKLYIFTEIAKDLNLHKTAKRLFISQQSLSRHLKQLENHYHVKLVVGSQRLSLTEAGEHLLGEASKILDIENGLRLYFNSDTDNQSSGTLRIACSLARSRVYMPQIVREFNDRYPAVAVSFVNENSFRGLDPLKDNEVDIIVGHAQENSPQNIVSKELFEVGGRIIVSDKLLRKQITKDLDAFITKGLTGADLADFPIDTPLALTSGKKGRSWVLDTLPITNTMPHVLIDPINIDRLVSLCENGKAMLLLSDIFVDYIRQMEEERLKDCYVFPHLVDGKLWTFMETYSYDGSKRHPKYFFEFIEILENYFATH